MSKAKLKHCPYCLNATIDHKLTPENDLSYIPIGKAQKGYRMFIRSGDGRTTGIIVDSPNNETDLAETRAIYIPKYCPECGRQLVENRRFDDGQVY